MSNEIKGRRVWITRDHTNYSTPYDLWATKPEWDGSCWWNKGTDRTSDLLVSICLSKANKYLGLIPKHVKAGGENAIVRGYLYVAADWDE